MKNPFNKKKKKQEAEVVEGLDERILRSPEYRALCHMNYIMNFYDEISLVNEGMYSPETGNEKYINARMSANLFMEELLEVLNKKIEYIEQKDKTIDAV